MCDSRPRAGRGSTPLLVAMIALGFALRESVAIAGNSLNSSETPDTGSPPPPPAPRNDFTIVPVAGGSTDVGVGGGFFSALTRDQAGHVPYVWNVEAAWFITFALQDGKTVRSPYDDGYLKLTVPRLFGAPIQLELRPSFTDEETLYYYGMGNASTTVAPPGAPERYFQYGRVHPRLSADLALRVVDHVAAKVGVAYIASWLQIPQDSKLASDMREGSADTKALIGNTSGLQSVALFRYGLEFDTRDNETSPHRGTWDEADIKLSPGGTTAFPYRYGQATATLRAYLPIVRDRVTLAARLVGDVLFGDVPFVELPRYEDTYALGGSMGVRGVPAQRYYGKVKAFGNLELRARLVNMRLLGKAMNLGGAWFVDAGRLWADTRPHPDLDGRGIGIKYGVGTGLRLSSGSAFVLRADVAWSPDATPIGGYVAAGETF